MYFSIQCITGPSMIKFITVPFLPPNSLNFSLINSNHVTFTWNSISESINCEAVHYKINTTECSQYQNNTGIGIACPTFTDTNSVSCNITLATFPETCEIIIQPVVCGNVSRDQSVFPIDGNWKLIVWQCWNIHNLL